MKNSTETQAHEKRVKPCKHRDSAVLANNELCCPTDLAIRCANDILDALSELNTLEDQKARFSLILQSHLASLFKMPILCIWSLNEKLSTEELVEAERASYTQYQGIEFPKPLHPQLNPAIISLNQKYDSVGFLETLIKGGVGTSHVFGLEPQTDGVLFTAYPREGLADKGIVFRHLLPHPNLGSINECLDRYSKNTEATAVQDIATYLEAWNEGAASFRETLSGFASHHNKALQITLDLPSLKEACSHIALIALYAKNNGFSNVSYILAPTMRGAAHSSMVVFWPTFEGFRNHDVCITFLLHLILGINAIRARSEEEMRYTEEVMSGILLHDMKNLGISVLSIYQQVMRNWDKYEDTQKKELFASMLSTMLLNSSAKTLGISQSLGPNPGRHYMTIAKLYDELYIATRFHDLEVVFEDQDRWLSCQKEIDNSVMTILSNLIGNARKASVFNKRVALSIYESKTDCTFRVKSQKPTPDAIKRILQEPKSPKIPGDKKGIWICRTLLDRCKGKLELRSPEGEYKTVFEVTMPWER